MKRPTSYFIVGLTLAAVLIASCESKKSEDGRTDTYSSGAISFASDEDVSPIIEGGESEVEGNDGVVEGINDTEEKAYDVVEQMPAFPGGDIALLEYLDNNIHYPTTAAENNVQGRVIIGFVVERDGSISSVQVLRSVDPSLDEEAMRVVKSMPKWIPGKQNGSTMRVKFQVPITFRLQ